MLFISIKDHCSNALPLFIWTTCFSHVGDDDEAEMDDGKVTFYCPLSVWAAAHSAKKKEHRGLWALSICVSAWPGWGLLLSKEGRGDVSVIKHFQSWRCPSETQVAVHSSSSCWEEEGVRFHTKNVLKCQRSDSVSVVTQQHLKAGHRYFINAWKWLLSRALDSKCNFLSAISPQKEEAERERFNFKL